jgi:uncharacterized protein
MSTFVFRLKAPRPTFAQDMNETEREIMARHAAHWQPWIESGQMVIFGPVLDASGSWGLGVVEADDEEELRAFAAHDPVVTTATGTIEIGKLLGGFIRPRPADWLAAPGDDEQMRQHERTRVGEMKLARKISRSLSQAGSGG